jgi:hypothetical protein
MTDIVVVVGEFGRSRRLGVSTSGKFEFARPPLSLAHLLQHRGCRRRDRPRGNTG